MIVVKRAYLVSDGGDEVLVDDVLADEGEEEGGGLLEVMKDAAGLFLKHFVCLVLSLEHVFFIGQGALSRV